jgi:antitoxin component YwqK of YwqJK toxin-antitoxin module
MLLKAIRMKIKYTLLFVFFIIISSVLLGQNEVIPQDYQKFYYENGKVSSEGTMRDGQPDGYWLTYYENGILKSEGNRVNFLLDSTWKFYSEEGSLVLIINYKEGQKSGLRTTIRESEIIEEYFENDIKQGLTTWYFPDSTISKTTWFVDGREDGLSKEFGEDGRVVTLTVYKKGYVISREKINRLDSEERKQCLCKFFHENGLVRLEGTYRNDLEHGYFKEYDEDGKLIATAKWVDGEKQKNAIELVRLTVDKEYYPDGSVKTVQSYRNGVPQGVRREYAEEGTITAGYVFDKGKIVGEGITGEDGVRNGEWKLYFNTGELKAEGKYVDGIKVGKWTYYHKNGKVEQTGVYDKQGRPRGEWVWYYPSGNILREEAYLDGLLDGLTSEYSEEGIVIAEGEFIEGEEEGPWIYQYGDHREEGNYSYGMRNGVWKYYTSEGQLMFEGEFIEDNPNGKHVYYFDNGKVKDEIEYMMGFKEGNWKKYNPDGTLFLVISYENGIEKKYDGITIKPEFEESFDE